MALKVEPFGSNIFPAQFEVTKTVTLQKTDMTEGNNKFYQLELHQSGDKYRIYSCYGRTGTPGKQEERIPNYNPEYEFEKIKKEKTSKGYREVKVAVTSKGTDVGNSKIISDDIKKDKLITANAKPSVNLDREIEMLVKRLYEEAGNGCKTQLDGSLKSSTENPLGTLTLTQINEGKKALDFANSLLIADPSRIDTIKQEIVSVTNEFYSVIPQQIPLRPRDEDGRKEWLRKFALNNKTILDEKYEMLDLLSDVEGMIKGFGTDDIGKKYQEINSRFNFCPFNSPDFISIKNFVESTQSSRHDWKLKVKNVWKMEVGAQSRHDSIMNNVGNIRPLFHGSGPANILGICKKGLLVRPPGVYITGALFGNGIYFADKSTKSSQYSWGRYGGSRGYGNSYFMFVANVALGKIKEYQYAQSNLQQAPIGYNSVMGKKGGTLVHDEYIIYDSKQEKLNYLVEFTM